MPQNYERISVQVEYVHLLLKEVYGRSLRGIIRPLTSQPSKCANRVTPYFRNPMFPPSVRSASQGSAHLLNMCDFILGNTLTKSHFADPGDRAFKGMGPLACWDCGFESCRGHGCLSLVNVVLSGRGLWERLITCPEESYRVWCVCVIVKPR
jgi:hypothetical protein